MFTYQQLPFEETEYLVLYKDGEFVGAMHTRPNAKYKSWEVAEVAVKQKSQGLGTQLYKVALALYPTLIPCRIPGEIRGGAEAVWKSLYNGANKDLVTHVPISDGRHPKEKPWLNAKYEKKGELPLPGQQDLGDKDAIDVIDEADKFLFGKLL